MVWLGNNYNNSCGCPKWPQVTAGSSRCSAQTANTWHEGCCYGNRSPRDLVGLPSTASFWHQTVFWSRLLRKTLHRTTLHHSQSCTHPLRYAGGQHPDHIHIQQLGWAMGTRRFWWALMTQSRSSLFDSIDRFFFLVQHFTMAFSLSLFYNQDRHENICQTQSQIHLLDNMLDRESHVFRNLSLSWMLHVFTTWRKIIYI